MTPIVLDGVTKRLGDTLAVDDVRLELGAGELFCLLGPSGCGKSTLLNLVAGLIEPDAGRILFGRRDVTRMPTHQRSAVMCFQSYALWPHLTVSENVAFGLVARGIAPAERARRVAEALKLVEMSRHGDRKPSELSGGQQQRVAIARAVVVRPACLLLDEPLSNLDARLRQQMRTEIRRICRTTGLTTLYVTHDQKEALSIADRIAIMSAGRIVQVGSPHHLYVSPNSAFVAEFLGQANLVAATLARRESAPDDLDRLGLDSGLGPLHAFADPSLGAECKEVWVAIRPELVQLSDPPSMGASPASARAGVVNVLEGELLSTAFLGDASEHEVQVGSVRLRALSAPARLDLSGRVGVTLPADQLVVLER